MARFSANLGFLLTHRCLPEAILTAAAAGFDAVECHFPYDEDPVAVRAALARTGLPLLALNTVRGDRDGDFGQAAVPGRETEARAAIDQAVTYGAEVGAGAVHVMAGRTTAAEADATFVANLRYAAQHAAAAGLDVLIEPINHCDVPDYHLVTVEQGRSVIEAVGHPAVGLMFDCYHVQISQGDLLRRLDDHLDVVGHIQFASVPNRAEPDEGELAYPQIFEAIDALGWDGFLGAVYRPRTTTDEGLGWLSRARGFTP
ncbi:MAG: TIM barrel protein [Actinomycetia bacterium]|nr:TIM barrel protein [Actinomycetes bacterium]